MRDIETLKFDPANSRKHDERNIKAIMESLKQHGQRKPIVIYSDMIVAGNGTVTAAKRLGWTEIWVNNDPFPSLEAAKAYALQDNRSAELAAWDDVQLGDTLSELKEAGWDIESIGFNEYDLENMVIVENFEDTTTHQDKGKDPIEKLDGFLNAKIKQIILFYDAEKYPDILKKLEEYRKDFGLEDNSQVVERLLNC